MARPFDIVVWGVCHLFFPPLGGGARKRDREEREREMNESEESNERGDGGLHDD